MYRYEFHLGIFLVSTLFLTLASIVYVSKIVVNNYFVRCRIYTTTKKTAVYHAFVTSIYDFVIDVNCFFVFLPQSIFKTKLDIISVCLNILEQ